LKNNFFDSEYEHLSNNRSLVLYVQPCSRRAITIQPTYQSSSHKHTANETLETNKTKWRSDKKLVTKWFV